MLSTTVEYTDAMASRTRDPAATKAAILAAARMQFGQSGFEKTTIRSVASAAGVDPALVMHYFGNKDGLFAAVSRLDISPPDLSGVAPEDVAEVMLPLFVEVWGPDGPFLPLLRAASSSQTAGDALLEEREVGDGGAADATAGECAPRAQVPELDTREQARPAERRNHVYVRHMGR